MSNGGVSDICQNFKLAGSETEKSMGDKTVSTKASKAENCQIKLQNMLLETQICCHSADVQGSDILTKIVVVSNTAAILDTECVKLLFRGHILCS